ALSQAIAGFSARRSLPRWRRDWFKDSPSSCPRMSRASTPFSSVEKGVDGRDEPGHDAQRDVVLFADTFNRYFERENLDAALTVLAAAGYRVHLAAPADGSSRPLCCGRTFLSIGKVDEAKTEAERTLTALAPFLARGVPVVGLEPSCLLGFRDEIPAIIKDDRAPRLAAIALLLEEFLGREARAGRLDLPLAPVVARALVHGHCHQKSFDAFSAVEAVLKLVPGLAVETIESSCCGMAGSFGYCGQTIHVPFPLGGPSLLPPRPKAARDCRIRPPHTPCRLQIHRGQQPHDTRLPPPL